MAQAIFANRLLQTIVTTAPNLDAATVLGMGASEIRNGLNGADLSHVIDAYMVGIKDVFACSLAGAALAALISLVIPFKRLPDHSKGSEKAFDAASTDPIGH